VRNSNTRKKLEEEWRGGVRKKVDYFVLHNLKEIIIIN